MHKKLLEIYDYFDNCGPPYEHKYLNAAIELKDVITPDLIDSIEEVKKDPYSYVNKLDTNRHSLALVLLGHFKEKKAHQLIVDIYSLVLFRYYFDNNC